MKKHIVYAGIFFFLTSSVYGWNYGPKYVKTLNYRNTGLIWFSLIDDRGNLARCKTGARSQWWIIEPCNVDNRQCQLSTDRIAAMLLAAKLSGSQVYLKRSGCNVTETSIR